MDNTNSNIHVAVFAFPFGSHGTALLSVIRRLAYISSTSNLHFSFFSTSHSLNSLFPKGDENFPNIRPFGIRDGKYVASSPLDEIDLFLKASTAPGALIEAMAKAEADVGAKVNVVIGDAFLWFLGDVAQDIGVPWVAVWNSGEHSLSIHLHMDLLRQRFDTFGEEGKEGKEEETLDCIAGLSKIRIKDVPDGVFTGKLDSTIALMFLHMSEVLPSATAVCINTCEEWDPVVTNDLKSQLRKVFCIGVINYLSPPLQVPDTHNCLGWLDKQKTNSVVYISFGSSGMATLPEVVALAEALQAGAHKFIWSLKDHLKVLLPIGFEENNKVNGMVVPWVPQINVLEHEAVGVFITHFGYGSIFKSIAAEVPMIGRPFFGDQGLNGRLVEAVWQIGLQAEGGVFTKEGILKSLDSVLLSEEGEKMRENIKILNKLMRNATAPDGSSNKNFDCLLEILTNC